ncbi:hypothetical protein K7432_005415 [Basidiobolus ranarum]|uniref:Arrestin-like N-terminal domain-containing protein n=1 Tax=Basidiobolus ranarum TaxID=34480 RepID=A0ABR2WWL2_9FUNG
MNSSMLKICPVSDKVRLVNSNVNVTGGVLTGNVFLRINNKPTKIISLTLRFESRVNEHGLSAIKPVTPTVVWKAVLLAAEEDPSITLPLGTHKFPFEIPLHKDLPDSLISDFVSVKYSLVTVLKKPGFGIGTSLHSSKKIQVYRTAEEEINELNRVVVTNRWPKYLEYEMLLDTKLATLGQNLPVEFTWRPLGEEVKILEVKSGILEKVVSKNGKLERWLPVKNDIVSNSSVNRCLFIQVHIPYRSRVFPDLKNQLIQVEHKLEMRVIFTVAEKINSIRLKCELVITMPFDETEDQLPTYTQALLTPRLVLY